MNLFSKIRPAAALLALGVLTGSLAASEFKPGDGYTPAGSIAPRDAKSIASSNWSVGAETMDRDYTIYANWKSYLGPLGVKKARIQSGWAKTEKTKGEYDWAWMDEIIPDMVDKGVEPWVCLCYGNPIYPDGGGTGLSGGLPRSDEALAAWDKYVTAFVNRYQDRVDEWEVWNEPGLHGSNGPQIYADFFMRTARTIRKAQPGSTLIALALPGLPLPFAKDFLEVVKKADALDLVDVVSYHPYSYNPDDSYQKVNELKEIVRSFSDDITLLQGENGAPSVRGKFGALKDYDWDEERQAKWAQRRLLGDLGRDIPTSYFAICDMVYLVGEKGRDSDLRDDPSQVKKLLNTKGLLAVDLDRKVTHPKKAYSSVQHITAIFDSTVKRVHDDTCEVSGGGDDSSFSVFHYRSDCGGDVVTLWRSSDRPGARPETENVKLTIQKGQFKDPVLADLLSGEVYDIDKSLWKAAGDTVTFERVPVYDAVVVLAERCAVPVKK